MDSYPERPRIDVHEERNRQRRIWESLRKLGLGRPLLVDSMYAAGDIEQKHWGLLHQFRESRIVFLESRRRGEVRRVSPHAKARKMTGLSMTAILIARALRYEQKMSPECFQWAQFLTGELCGRVEPIQAKRTAWEIEQFLGASDDRVWSDPNPWLVDCRTREK